MTDDSRFTNGLMYDITCLLHQHGYRLPEGAPGERALGNTTVALLRLCATYEGDLDITAHRTAPGHEL